MNLVLLNSLIERQPISKMDALTLALVLKCEDSMIFDSQGFIVLPHWNKELVCRSGDYPLHIQMFVNWLYSLFLADYNFPPFFEVVPDAATLLRMRHPLGFRFVNAAQWAWYMNTPEWQQSQLIF